MKIRASQPSAKAKQITFRAIITMRSIETSTLIVVIDFVYVELS